MGVQKTIYQTELRNCKRPEMVWRISGVDTYIMNRVDVNRRSQSCEKSKLVFVSRQREVKPDNRTRFDWKVDVELRKKKVTQGTEECLLAVEQPGEQTANRGELNHKIITSVYGLSTGAAQHNSLSYLTYTFLWFQRSSALTARILPTTTSKYSRDTVIIKNFFSLL